MGPSEAHSFSILAFFSATNNRSVFADNIKSELNRLFFYIKKSDNLITQSVSVGVVISYVSLRKET
jgi:hypothetical protein